MKKEVFGKPFDTEYKYKPSTLASKFNKKQLSELLADYISSNIDSQQILHSSKEKIDQLHVELREMEHKFGSAVAERDLSFIEKEEIEKKMNTAYADLQKRMDRIDSLNKQFHQHFDEISSHLRTVEESQYSPAEKNRFIKWISHLFNLDNYLDNKGA
jgi:uncharacterized coiled-coil DUF342 family protein